MDPSLTLAPIPSADRFQITNSRNGVNKAEEEGRGNPECGVWSVAFPLKTGYFQWSVLLLFSSRNASQPGKSFAGELGFLEKRFQQTFSGTRIRFRELF